MVENPKAIFEYRVDKLQVDSPNVSQPDTDGLGVGEALLFQGVLDTPSKRISEPVLSDFLGINPQSTDAQDISVQTEEVPALSWGVGESQVMGNCLGFESAKRINKIGEHSVSTLLSEQSQEGVVTVEMPDGALSVVVSNQHPLGPLGTFHYQPNESQDLSSSDSNALTIEFIDAQNQLQFHQLSIGELSSSQVVSGLETLLSPDNLLMPSTPTAAHVVGAGLPNSHFAPLVEQSALVDAALTINNEALYYHVDHEGQLLTATQGANGPTAFEVMLSEDGSFELSHYLPIDGQDSVYTVDIGQLNFMSVSLQGLVDSPYLADDWLEGSGKQPHHKSLSQSIPVNPHDPYLLSLTLDVLSEEAITQVSEPILVKWDQQVVAELNRIPGIQGVELLVDAGNQSESLLSFEVPNNDEVQFSIAGITLQNLAQPPLHIPISVTDGVSEATLPISLSQESILHFNASETNRVIYDNPLFQTIVVADNPLIIGEQHTKQQVLQLDRLFEQLDIESENRAVVVTQDAQDATLFHVGINHRTDNQREAIEIADVYLKLAHNPAGLEGLELFSKLIGFDSG